MRKWYKNARYHVMARSVRSLPLYKDEEDYEIFFMMLQETMEKYPFIIHSYCLMTTHFHMLITTVNDEIWKIMSRLMQNYAMYFNRKYGTRGHVFDSRYVSCLIEDGGYFLQVSRYIHLNPVRASMVRNPLEYKYSSYVSFILNKENGLLSRQEVLSYFKGNEAEQYRQFVEGAISHAEHERMIQKDMGEDENWLPW
ncbi:MAG: transposase [Lachnospiraceae bacterium]